MANNHGSTIRANEDVKLVIRGDRRAMRLVPGKLGCCSDLKSGKGCTLEADELRNARRGAAEGGLGCVTWTMSSDGRGTGVGTKESRWALIGLRMTSKLQRKVQCTGAVGQRSHKAP